jgi:hypothetical protein
LRLDNPFTESNPPEKPFNWAAGNSEVSLAPDLKPNMTLIHNLFDWIRITTVQFQTIPPESDRMFLRKRKMINFDTKVAENKRREESRNGER